MDRRNTLLAARQPTTIWITALPGAGKTTLALALERELKASNEPCCVLDGDRLRHGINSDLGFSPEDRRENIRRIAELARLFNDAGVISIVAVVSPYAAHREMARSIIGDAYLEVYLSTSLAVCESRDPKGMYAKARRGEIPGFTGVSAPYEAPVAADLTLDTSTFTVDECVDYVQALTPRASHATPLRRRAAGA